MRMGDRNEVMLRVKGKALSVIRYSYIRLAVVGVWEFLTLFGKFPIPNSQFLIAGGIILTEEKATHCTNNGFRLTNNEYTNNDKTSSQFQVPSS